MMMSQDLRDGINRLCGIQLAANRRFKAQIQGLARKLHQLGDLEEIFRDAGWRGGENPVRNSTP
ncbi:MAG: hypothetical protein EPN47_06295 [Acidobacteria bacterium]|nr:MAG: hypothetical protein EPN47_06295 [Acidobacteriota bacterium]